MPQILIDLLTGSICNNVQNATWPYTPVPYPKIMDDSEGFNISHKPIFMSDQTLKVLGQVDQERDNYWSFCDAIKCLFGGKTALMGLTSGFISYNVQAVKKVR